MKKRLTIISYKPETCTICGGTLAVNDGAVRWGGTDEWGRYRPMFAHPACDNPDEDNFHVASCPPLGSNETVDRNSRFD